MGNRQGRRRNASCLSWRCSRCGQAIMAPILKTDPRALHVVFSAECIPAFDWESCGLFHSFYRSQQAGKITRLLACSDDQLRTYPKHNMDMGPTFVHKNM